MGFTRSPVLKLEVEVQLAEQLRELWANGKTAREIANILEFGKRTITVDDEEVLNPYAKLQMFHVWNYRTKFNKGDDNGKYMHLKKFRGKFPKRGNVGIQKGKSRYKVEPEEAMTFHQFEERLDAEQPYVEYDGSVYAQYVHRKRAYLIMHYWCPLRKSELLERVGGDFKKIHGFLKINLFRKKKYYKPADKPEPFYLKLDLPLVHEVVEWIERFDEDERPFKFSSVMAWRYVKEVFPDFFPHGFRFSWITAAIEHATEPGKIIVDLLADTGLNIETIKEYIMQNPKYRGSINQRTFELIANA